MHFVSWMNLGGRLLATAAMALMVLVIVGCPPAAEPIDDPAPGQTLDSDSDGVVDEEDDCPNTAAGAAVGDDGCELPTPPAPDDDADGVANDDDDCPDTPAEESANADGCSPSQRDTDGDGVTDDLDLCASTPATVDIDEDGCPLGDPEAPDTDGDGVGDDIDQCTATPPRVEVDANGCAATERDTDGDGVVDAEDDCPDTPEGADVDENGCEVEPSNGGGPGGGGTPVCGNGVVEAGEGCDDGNTADGDGCGANCQLEVVGPQNDSCGSPLIADDGSLNFSNLGATTDGPDEPESCNFFEQTQVEADIWYCYTASCTGQAVASLCGSNFDTKLAVYEGCGCPSQLPLACSDDDCGSAIGNVESRASFPVVAGEEYMIRVGGFNGEQGDGRLTLSCGGDACGASSNDCFTESSEDSTGCNDPTCCQTVCAVDQFCCDVSWDSFCASEASGFCTDGFPACQVGIGSCQIARDDPGCGTVDCCDTVCASDPFCCINEWDDTCVNEANSMCFLTCGSRSGDCFTTNEGPGCDAISCCEAVCPDDPFCCETAWDEECVNQAEQLCR